MGAHPYVYFVAYEKDIQHALDSLREREFQAGRYNPVLPVLDFDDPRFLAIRPGPRHQSIAQAVADAARAGEGTRSILDIDRVDAKPDFGVAAPPSDETLVDLFGTDKPTRETVKRELGELLESVERGHCVYVVVHERDAPADILFAGYSYD